MRATLLCLALLGCETPKVAEGGACEEGWHCEGDLTCFEGVCRPRVGAGERCDPQQQGAWRHCQPGLVCADDGLCRTSAEMAERAAVAERAREAEMLRASGVAPPATEGVPLRPPDEVEAPPPTAGPGVPVRVVHVMSQRTAFAACRAGERLIGGGCNAAYAPRASYPSHHNEVDTVGARWNCESSGGFVEAYALCQPLPE